MANARRTSSLARRIDENLEARANPPEKMTVAKYVRAVLDRQQERINAVMPRGIDSERFSQLVLTAVRATPELLECFETREGEVSVLLAVMQAAAVGLEPNTPTQDAWLLPRRNKGRMECQLMISYRGLIKLARRSGDIKTIFAEVVREGDHFVYERGLEDDRLEWHPGETRGDITHAFAVVRFQSGGYDFRVLTRADIEARRARSDSWRNEKARPFSPWTTAFEAMARKSAIRALAPSLPLTAEVERVLATDERTLRIDDDTELVLPVDEPDDTPAELEAPAAVDVETGEVIDPPAGEPVPEDGDGMFVEAES